MIGSTRTQDATLSPGANEQVVVSGARQGITINTTDASIGSTIDVALLNSLPVQSRASPAALFTLQPGYANGSVTGARTDQTSTTVDAIDVNDIAAGGGIGTIIPNQPLDSVEEFTATVAGLPSDTGTGSGGQYRLITKQGTNTFHGNINEYHRDTTTTANTWFNNNSGLPRTPLIQNQFGGNAGGPVLKDKLFFFFNFYDSRIIQSSAVTQTVPLDTFRNGTLGYINQSNPDCSASSRANTDPGCITYLNRAQVAALDPKGVGFDQSLLSFINSRYPHANDLTLGDGVNTGGFRFTVPTPTIATNYVARVDYNVTPTQRIFGRVTLNRQNVTNTVQFPGDPTAYYDIDRSYGYVVGHTWQIGSSKVNQFYYGDNISKLTFPAQYRTTSVTTYGFGPLASPYGGYGVQQRRVPIPEVRDDFSWQLGRHTVTFGGQFKFIKTNSLLVGNFNGYSIGLGGFTTGLDASLRPADINTDSSSTGAYDSVFATALGRIASIGSSFDYTNKGVLPQGSGETRRYRFYQTEVYLGDNWKVTPKLTLSYGLRYALYTVPYEVNGAESIQNFTFDKYIAARVSQSAAGQSGDSSVPFLTYKLGGKANHAAPLYSPSYKDFAPRFAINYAPTRNSSFNASAGIIYDRTVINAVNFIQDQSSQLFQSSASINYGQTDPRAALATDPRIGPGLAVPPPPSAPTIAIPQTPYVTATGTPIGLPNNIFNYVVDPTLKDPYSIAFTGGFEHQFPANFVMKLSYAGRLGRRLLAQADASQLIDFPDKQSGQLLSSAVADLERQLRNGATADTVRPEPWFENVVYPGVGTGSGYASNTALLADFNGTLLKRGDFADFMQFIAANGLMPSNVGLASQFAGNTFITNKGFSAYNGLLLTVAKNYTNGLRLDFYYTWSHSIDNVSAPANYIAQNVGYDYICDVLRPRLCRANSDFDVSQRITGDFIYDLPVGRGKPFLSNASRWLNEAVGGWSLSGLPTFDTGYALNTSTDAYIAGYANNAPAIFNGSRSDVSSHIHKDSSGALFLFADPAKALSEFSPPTGFTIGNRNSLRGPRIFTLDMGLAKTFGITSDNRVNLQFRADAFNVLNHPVFSNPAVNIDSKSNFGQITGTLIGPRVGQFSLRLEF